MEILGICLSMTCALIALLPAGVVPSNGQATSAERPMTESQARKILTDSPWAKRSRLRSKLKTGPLNQARDAGGRAQQFPVQPSLPFRQRRHSISCRNRSSFLASAGVGGWEAPRFPLRLPRTAGRRGGVSLQSGARTCPRER